MLLTIGSPTLAAYSLALTVLNGRWIARRFLPYTYPNARQAVQVLSSLQQSPIQINTDNSLLSSLIILPSNDAWWNTLVEALDYTHTWSISAATSIAWVIIAYIFTIADSFTGDVTAAVNANGQGVGSLWIWLLAIVSGWLLISPKCDSHRLHQAMTRANNIAFVATPCDGPVPTSSLSDEQAISLKQGVMDTLFYDESCTVPIYNYARFLSWVQAVEEVSDIFNAASERARRHSSVDPNIPWGKDTKYLAGIDHKNRIGTQSQVEAYCLIPGEHPMKTRAKGRTVWGPDVISRILIASSVALFLQWGATGAAVVVVWLTPTKDATVIAVSWGLEGTHGM
ncbi:hypothetical protein H0H92_012347 [Tricholoma furcatifolium]|nr:hypothetical protein H0H92_012347 [Tricholoma furcatifolium]